MLHHNDVMFVYELRTMLFTFKENCFIKILRQEKGWGGKRNGLLFRLTIFYGKSWRNSAAAMSSSEDLSEVRRSFRVSTGRRAISSSEVNCQVPAAYRAEFRRTVCMATQQPGLKSGWLCCLGSFAEEHVSSFQPGRSQGQSAHLLGESWPTDHQQIHWSVAWQTEGSSSSERWTHWTCVLNIWFICCHALLYSVSLCVLKTWVHFGIVYRALPWSCDKK